MGVNNIVELVNRNQGAFVPSAALAWELKQLHANPVSLVQEMSEERFTVLEQYSFYINVAKRIASTYETAFKVGKKRGWDTVSTANLIGNFQILQNALCLSELKRYFPRSVLHPLCEMLLGMIEQFEWRDCLLIEHLPDGRICAEHWNELLKEFRKKAASKSFQLKLRRWQAMQTSHFESASDLIASLWAYGPSKMLFVRVDLSIRAEYQDTVHVFQIKDYFERLCINRRGKRSIFEHYVGIVWCLESTSDNPYHYHCLFIFNGASVQDGVYYADLIGKYWQTVITKGKGTYHNCNREESDYPEPGIGLIDRNDFQKRRYLLENVISYLTKEDHEIRRTIEQDAQALGLPGKHIHTFDCSTPLKGRKSNRGRPRKS